MLEENTLIALRQLLPALKALAKSVDRSYWTGTYEGSGAMAVKSYRSLQQKIAELLPDDHYVTDALVLEIAPDATEQQKVAQVQLGVSQLVHYLEGMLKSNRAPGDVEDLSDLGRELRDRIIITTRDAIRKAMANMDIDMEIDEHAPWGKKSKKRIKIKGGSESAPGEESEKVDIEIDMDDDEDEDEDEDKPKGKPPVA